MAKPRTHLVIPDCQVKPGVPTDHLRWIGQYIVDQFAGDDLAVICLGDFWDMPSLSSYDKGKRQMEGRRYVADVEAGNRAIRLLTDPLDGYNEGRRRGNRGQWRPELHFLDGNHENRITRAAENDPQMEGLVSLDHLERDRWQVHPFLEPVWLDGVGYAHYWVNPMTGRPYGGQSIDTRLKTIGHSFTMGHQQQLLIGVRYVAGRSQHGLVAGACYLHDEEYLGPQGNFQWRGVVVCHEVDAGSYDVMTVSLRYLCKKYEGVALTSMEGENAYA